MADTKVGVSQSNGDLRWMSNFARYTGVTFGGEGGFQLNVTMTLFWKKWFGDTP